MSPALRHHRRGPGGGLPSALLALALSLALAAGCRDERTLGGTSSTRCDALAPPGDPRVQLRVLGCVTALAVASGAPRQRTLAERGLREVYEELQRRPFTESELGYWTELYRLSAQLHPQESKLGDIPLTVVNAHHHALPFWVRASLGGPLGALVHFDTHADMDDLPRPEAVRAAVASLRAGKDLDRSWHVLAHAVHRNSMPVTGAVLAAGVREVLWAKPSWARDPVDFRGRAFFFARPGSPESVAPLKALDEAALAAFFRTDTGPGYALHYDPADNEDRWLPRRELEQPLWRVVSPAQRPHAAHFAEVTPVRLSVVTTSRPAAELLAAVPGERFVLDVDLDYFVNLGHDAEPTDDFASDGQRLLRSVGDLKGARARGRGGELGGALLAAERRLIEERLARFGELLWALRGAGKRPSVISLADSTNLPFAAQPSGEEGAAFVPAHHTYWVRTRVLELLREVFGEDAGAGPATRAKAPAAATPPPPAPAAAPAGGPGTREPLGPVVELLGRALASTVGAMGALQRSPRLSKGLLILHALASHGPDGRLRRAAQEAARLAALALPPALLLPPAALDPGENREAQRRVAFARRYGAPEARLAEAGARWLGTVDGGRATPDLEADAAPTTRAQTLAALGLGPDALGPDASLTDFARRMLESPVTEAPGQAALTRAYLGLHAVRGLVGLHAPGPPTEDDGAAARGDRPPRVETALLRAVLWALGWLGADPGAFDALTALPLLAVAGGGDSRSAAAWLAGVSARALAPRLVPVLEALCPTADEELLLRLGTAAAALTDLGAPAPRLWAAVRRRADVLPAETTPPASLGAWPSALRRAHSRVRLGLGDDALATLTRAALPALASLTPAAATEELLAQLQALLSLVGAVGDEGQARVPRALLGREWGLLDGLQTEILASARAELVAALLLARRVAGEAPEALAVANLQAQLLADQRADGSWGPLDEAAGVTLGAVKALAAQPGVPRPGVARALEVLRSAPPRPPFDGATPRRPGAAGSLLRR